MGIIGHLCGVVKGESGVLGKNDIRRLCSRSTMGFSTFLIGYITDTNARGSRVGAPQDMMF